MKQSGNAKAERSEARFANGVAVVAGGSGGVGAAVARALAAEGADIALTFHRNGEKADAVAAEIRSLGRRVSVYQVDLTEEEAVSAFLRNASEEFGKVHTAVYAAGPYIDMRHISRIDPALFRRTLSTDIFGCYNLVHAALSHLRDSRGAFVAVVTPAIRRYIIKDVLSASPKAAIEALVRGVAAEEGRFGIRANCVGVGAIEDGMYHQLVASGDFDERFLQRTREMVALRRLGSAHEVAEAVAFLASDRASYITGQTLMVDGGWAV